MAHNSEKVGKRDLAFRLQRTSTTAFEARLERVLGGTPTKHSPCLTDGWMDGWTVRGAHITTEANISAELYK